MGPGRSWWCSGRLGLRLSSTGRPRADSARLAAARHQSRTAAPLGQSGRRQGGTGLTLDVKADIGKFLAGRGYTVAPITFDNADYIFSRAYDNAFDSGDKALMKRVAAAYVPYMESKLDYWERQSMRLFGREVSQTMLIHANFINSDYLADLIKMLHRRGYKVVDLETALKDEAYNLPDTYTGRAGISWIHRWAMAKGRDSVLPNEPEVPEFVMKASGFDSE